MGFKILNLSQKKDMKEYKNSINKAHSNFCEMLNKNTEQHQITIDCVMKLINLKENCPIKIKTREGVMNSYWCKWEAMINTCKYILNPDELKPFIDSLIKYLNLDKDNYYKYFHENICLIQESIINNKLIWKENWPEKYKNQYNKLFGNLEEQILKGCQNNSEIFTILSPHLLKNLPINWIKEYTLEKYFGKDVNGRNSSDQGSHNGPDFVFKDEKNKLVGIEVMNLAKNYVTVDLKKIKNVNNYASVAMRKSNYTKLLNNDFSDFVKNIRHEILTIKQSKNYVKCSRYYLVIILDSVEILPGWHEATEIILNNNSKIKSKYKKIVLI